MNIGALRVSQSLGRSFDLVKVKLSKQLPPLEGIEVN